MVFVKQEDHPEAKFTELPPGEDPESPVIDQCWPTKEDEKSLLLGDDVSQLAAPGLDNEQKAAINEALSKLPRQQLYIVSAKMAGASERAIAGELHLNRLTVRREYQRAVAFLREQLA